METAVIQVVQVLVHSNPSRRLAGVCIGVAGIVIAPEVPEAALDDPSTNCRLAGVQIGVAAVVSSSSNCPLSSGDRLLWSHPCPLLI